MIDIIIPAYNSHNTIIKTLSSIAMQLNRENLKVTIVNDGGASYTKIVNIFKPLLDIQEIGYTENKGPGYARQYGIDHTTQEFITFIDADDTFYEACSLSVLSRPLEETNACYVISSFMQIGQDPCKQVTIPQNFTWVFGHMYRRSFLARHHIRFTSTRANEDVGFNTMCRIIARHDKGDEGGKALKMPTYEWHHNQASITRRGKDEYEFGICTPGYIYNTHNAFKVAQREGVTLKEIAADILSAAFSCFIYYNIALARKVPAETLAAIEELSRKLYYDYYKDVLPYISEDSYKNIYTDAYNSKAKLGHLSGIIFKMTLDDFIELMFSKEPDNSNYAELESGVQSIAEKL